MSAIDGVLAGLKMRRDEGRQALDDKERADDLAAKQEERAYQRSERARMIKQRDDTAAAAAPTTVEAAPVAMPIGSRDEPGAPEDVGIRAAGQTFTSRADADKAAAAYNAEPAVAQRVANVARMGGDYAGSQQVMNLSRQGRTADLNLKTAEEAADRDKKLRELGGSLIKGGWAAVPGVYDQYNDGHTAQVIEDGKGGATVVKIGPDGTEVGRKKFSSLPEYFEGVAGQFDPKLWLDRQDKHAETNRLQGNSEADRALRSKEVDRKATHDDGMLGLRRQELTLQARRDAVAASSTADAIKRANAPAAPGQATTAESTFDNKTAADIAKERVNVEAKADLDAGKPAWSAQQIAQRKDAIVQAMFQQHTSRFIESAVTRALGGAQSDPAAYAAAFEQAQAAGMPLKRLGELGFKPPQRAPAGPAPAAMPAATRAATPAAPGANAPTAAQQPVAAAGAMPPVPFQQFVAQNITSPAGKQAISQRVMKELPEIQTRIKGITDVMALPMVSGAVKAKLKGELDMLAQDAQMMQAFSAGNPGV